MSHFLRLQQQRDHQPTEDPCQPWRTLIQVRTRPSLPGLSKVRLENVEGNSQVVIQSGWGHWDLPSLQGIIKIYVIVQFVITINQGTFGLKIILQWWLDCKKEMLKNYLTQIFTSLRMGTINFMVRTIPHLSSTKISVLHPDSLLVYM